MRKSQYQIKIHKSRLLMLLHRPTPVINSSYFFAEQFSINTSTIYTILLVFLYSFLLTDSLSYFFFGSADHIIIKNNTLRSIIVQTNIVGLILAHLYLRKLYLSIPSNERRLLLSLLVSDHCQRRLWVWECN